jgi:hypothetical protein
MLGDPHTGKSGVAGNPVPRIHSTYPSFVPAGIGDVRLVVGDAGAFNYTFVDSSVVHWNGSPRPTVRRIQNVCPGSCAAWLEATLFATDVSTPGIGAITVVNPAPGGGTSDSHQFPIRDPATRFFTVTPCRLLDSRLPQKNGPVNPVRFHAPNTGGFRFGGQCGIPMAGVRAVVFNITVVQPTDDGHLTFYPGYTFPTGSSINYSAGQTRAHQSIVGVDEYGNVGWEIAQPAGSLDLIVDVSGYFQ